MFRRRTFIVGLLLCMGFILLVTLPWQDFQDHAHPTRIRWIPFFSPPIRVRDVVGNVLLYVPLGFCARRSFAGARASWVVAVGAALLSFGTEAAQLYSHYRFPSSTDLVCNVIGAVIGIRVATEVRGRVPHAQ